MRSALHLYARTHIWIYLYGLYEFQISHHFPAVFGIKRLHYLYSAPQVSMCVCECDCVHKCWCCRYCGCFRGRKKKLISSTHLSFYVYFMTLRRIMLVFICLICLWLLACVSECVNVLCFSFVVCQTRWFIFSIYCCSVFPLALCRKLKMFRKFCMSFEWRPHQQQQQSNRNLEIFGNRTRKLNWTENSMRKSYICLEGIITTTATRKIRKKWKVCVVSNQIVNLMLLLFVHFLLLLLAG